MKKGKVKISIEIDIWYEDIEKDLSDGLNSIKKFFNRKNNLTEINRWGGFNWRFTNKNACIEQFKEGHK